MPDPDRFRAVADASATQTYYATLLHELTHWTGAPKRLDRLTYCRFGDPEYAFEELVAELGSVFLCRHLHIASAPRADHARYLASWLKCLKAHPRALFKAAALAQQAVDYLEDKAASEDQPLAA
jgi:antirestriction protein ArdC